jgi:LPXTG-motif cell wall-anchored protein
MLLAAMLAMVLAFAAPALAQSDPQVVADAKAKTATAGGPAGANADANCNDGIIESKAGGVVARAPCKPPPPPPPPPPAPAPAPKPAPAPAPAPPPPPPAPAPKAELPKSGGSGTASLFALGAGTLLVGGGLLARRFIK